MNLTDPNSFLIGKKVLVTGAAGFIGSHLVDALLEGQAKVLGIDNFITGHADNLKHLSSNSNFQFIEADVTTDPANYIPDSFQPDLVLHFASPASPPLYQAHPVETYLVNSLGTHYLLQYLLKNNPQARFLFASTSEAYGDPAVHPQPETYWGNVNPNGERSCYDESKRLGETISGVHARDFGLDVRIIRIFNTYGPRMDLNDGRVIPNFIKLALAGQALTIYGSGSQTRSYCYVSDLVEGILRMVVSDKTNGETVNLGNPGEFTVAETANIIWQLIQPGKNPAVLMNTKLPADDPARRQPDISKATQLLDWTPLVSFEEGLIKTIKYFKTYVRTE